MSVKSVFKWDLICNSLVRLWIFLKLHSLPAKLFQVELILVQINITKCLFLSLGTAQKINSTKQDEQLIVHKTSQQSNLDAPVLHDDDDALDCLVSFYGGVSWTGAWDNFMKLKIGIIISKTCPADRHNFQTDECAHIRQYQDNGYYSFC